MRTSNREGARRGIARETGVRWEYRLQTIMIHVMMGFVSFPALRLGSALYTPPPHLPTAAERFSFIGFLCSSGLYQLWCCVTVSDPDLAGFQSAIKELCACALPLMLRMSLL